ncbi:aminotransferase class III-fold pyridoxal phosphate-dependent enzyme [Streptomyces sp. NPDC020379]|uniref:aminotransferase class III-fold pyridoxal phosphate-dependent enzyme n=1 Tax=Streptomyces sp. NPDC020379 TaxID=3365071 RepID=UPI0037A2DCDD
MTLTRLPTTSPPTTRESVLRRQPAREAAARTYARSLPVVPVRARGLTVEGADGRRYLDCLSGAGALALGHNHPVVLEAIRAVLDSGAPLHAPDLATPVREAFTGELLATLPRGLADGARIRFCGPTAADALREAAALVRAATGRTEVLTLSGAPAETSLALSGLSDVFLTALGSGGRAPAAVVVEPVAGESAVLPAPDGLLRRARDITAARAIPLVVDETVTGVGRTGAFWAVEHSGIVPDVMVLSHAIGGSLPLAAVVHHAGLGGRLPADRADTCRGNQLAMAAGTATLRYVRENRLAGRAAALGAHILRRLRTLDHACVGEVRGIGLMIGIECAPGPAAAVRRECLRRGLIVGLGGPHSSVVRLLPPLTITDEQTEAVLDRLADALAAVDRTHRRAATPSTPKEAGPATPA